MNSRQKDLEMNWTLDKTMELLDGKNYDPNLNRNCFRIKTVTRINFTELFQK